MEPREKLETILGYIETLDVDEKLNKNEIINRVISGFFITPDKAIVLFDVYKTHRIMRGDYPFMFGEYAPLYVRTNEPMEQMCLDFGPLSYYPLFQNKGLFVASSGDAVCHYLLNDAILDRNNSIGLFDLNVLTKYYAFLKIFSINSLDFSERVSFLSDLGFRDNRGTSFKLYFDIILNDPNLPEDVRYFWRVMEMVGYIDEMDFKNIFLPLLYVPDSSKMYDRYHVARENIRNASFSFDSLDVFNNDQFCAFLDKNYPFDFIYLSNILDYADYPKIVEQVFSALLDRNPNVTILIYTFNGEYSKKRADIIEIAERLGLNVSNTLDINIACGNCLVLSRNTPNDILAR